METARNVPMHLCRLVLALAVALLAPVGLLAADPGAGRASPQSQAVQAGAVPAAKTPETFQKWWLKPNLRVATYEFLERGHLGRDLSVDEIMAWIQRLGGCDLLLIKGFHYWQGNFDDSSWGYPRFRDKIAALTPRLHRAGIKAGVFGFTQREISYRGGQDHERILGVWKEYVDAGVDILFVDEESGRSGLDIPTVCLDHCDQLRATFKLPVGIFLYGRASEAGDVGKIAVHADVVGEMGYNLFLEARGDYGLAEVTRAWSAAVKSTEGRRRLLDGGHATRREARSGHAVLA